MRPLTVINGVLLGTSLSIFVSLVLVLIVFLVIGHEHPRIEDEFRPLVLSMLIFFGMTIISAGSFCAMAVNHRWRWWSQGMLVAGLAGCVAYYWP
ncbi:MAG: hypothetical protein HKN77_03435 [Woeseiaceae bacterium]|nr:hypothetical protein [Woeseiaceae bacterium]